MSYPYLDFENKMKKVTFTDSTYKDYEFRIFNDVVYFHYLINGKAAVSDIIHFSLIEKNIFPPQLNDFPEACQYIKSYIDNIAFA